MSGMYDFFSLLSGGRYPWETAPAYGGIPYMTAADAGGGGDDPAVPLAVSPDLRRPLDLRATATDGPAVPPSPPAAAARPIVPGVLSAPAVPQPGLFGGSTDELMDQLLRRQLQRAMQPNWGKMAAAFAQAAMPSRVPVPFGAALGMAAGAMSEGEGGIKDALGSLKIMQDIRDARDKATSRKDLSDRLKKLDAYLEKRGSSTRIDTATGSLIAPSIGGTTPSMTASDAGGGGDDGGGPLDLIAKYESGGRNIEQGVVGPQGGYNPSVGRITGPSSASGPWQMLDRTYRDAASRTAPVEVNGQMVDPTSFSRAIQAPVPVQRAVAQQLFNEQGYKPWAPYNANLRAALARGGAGSQMASAGDRVRIEPLGSEAQPAGGGYQHDNALALLLAQIGAAAQLGGFGDIAKPYETYLYNQPGYKGAVRGAETAAEWGVREPIEQRARREQSALDQAREAARLKIELENKRAEQERAAELDIDPSKPQWVLNPQTGQPELRPMTRAELARRFPATAMPSPQAAPAVPVPAPVPVVPPGPLPVAPNLRAGGALPLAVPAPQQGAVTPPAAAPAAPAPAGPPGGILPPPPEVPKDYRPVWKGPERGWEVEVIPGTPSHQAEQERGVARVGTADTVLGSIDRALKMSGDYSTGAYGNILRNFPGTNAYNLSAELENLGSAVQIEEIMKMRQSSPTGAAMGNLTEGEGRVLRSAKASLDQAQTKPEFDAALKRLRATYIDTVYGSREKVAALVKDGKVSQRIADSIESLRERAEAEGRPAASQEQTGATKAPPMVGEVRQGYRYNGGNPADPSSYTKVQ